jgi:hypothetical protein
MFPSFDDVDYEFESEIKKTRELSCVLDFYANYIKNAQEDGFKKLIQIIESRNPDPDMEELEHEVVVISSYGFYLIVTSEFKYAFFFRFMNFMKCLLKIWTVVSACNVMIYP